jgi:hypothetical protein
MSFCLLVALSLVWKEGFAEEGEPEVWFEQAKVTASDAASGDAFGWALGVSGDTLAVGAYADDDLGDLSGSAYMFSRDEGQWAQVQKLTASDGEFFDQFGASVGVSGDTVIVGAPFDDDRAPDAGALYVFQADVEGVWAEATKLTASDGDSLDLMGWDVAIDHGTVVAGVRWDEAGGSAYVFEEGEGQGLWQETAKLTASDAESSDEFGHSVALDENVIIVGAQRDYHRGIRSGSAYVFQKGGLGGEQWLEVEKLTPPDGEPEDHFGGGVAVSGDWIAIGSHLEDQNVEDSGAVYLYQRVGPRWQFVQKLQAPDPAVNDRFGFSVAMEESRLLVSAVNDDGTSGSAYLFQKADLQDRWDLVSKLRASDGGSGDYFGRWVAMSEVTLAAGAPHSPLGSGWFSVRRRLRVRRHLALVQHRAVGGRAPGERQP